MGPGDPRRPAPRHTTPAALRPQARTSKDKAEKKALYDKMRPDPKDKKLAEERKALMDSMHEEWCARDEARESALCVNWRAVRVRPPRAPAGR